MKSHKEKSPQEIVTSKHEFTLCSYYGEYCVKVTPEKMKSSTKRERILESENSELMFSKQ
jgi:hypothetical protein